jgi:hypothetical protein
VDLRQAVVQFERLQRSRLRLRKRVVRRHQPTIASRKPHVGDAHMGERVARFPLQRALKIVQCNVEVVPGQLVPVKPVSR